jgi:hypothetical protein
MPRPMYLCDWCSEPCTGVDENGDPACPIHASEAAAERAPRRVIRLPDPIPTTLEARDRQIHNFVIGEFRSHGAIVEHSYR